MSRLAIDGTHNVRDTGGYPAVGGRTRPGQLFRGDALTAVTASGAADLAALRIGVVIDLRSPLERSQDHSRSVLPGAVQVWLPIVGGSRSAAVDDEPVGLESLYRQVLTNCGWTLTAAVSVIADSGERPVLVHCTAGKDRTGLVVALALEAAGVERTAVVADYTQSALNLDGAWINAAMTALVSRGVPISPALFEVLGGSPDHAMSDLLGWLDDQYGSVLGYLQAHGFLPDAQVALRREAGGLGGGDTGPEARARGGGRGRGGPGDRLPPGMAAHTVSVAQIQARLGLMRVAGGHLDLSGIQVGTSEVTRPGLQLTGFLEHFSADRLQIIGWIETAYLAGLEPRVRARRLDDYFALGFPALVVARGLHVMPDMVAAADRHDVPVFVTELETSRFASALTWFLIHALAPRDQIAAGLVDVHGEGVLILGEEGIGQSETVLELVRRGHRMVADDVVEVLRVAEDHLRGRSPQGRGHVIDIPGVGIVDVEELFGIGAIRTDLRIGVVVSLEFRDLDKEYERVGMVAQVQEVFGVALPRIVIPVQPGRNLAVIIEAAALTHRQRTLGYVAAAELTTPG